MVHVMIMRQTRGKLILIAFYYSEHILFRHCYCYSSLGTEELLIFTKIYCSFFYVSYVQAESSRTRDGKQ